MTGSDALTPGDFRFAHRSEVELADTDLGAVVYYGRYPLHIDRGVIAYRRSLGIEPLGPPGHLFVVRSLQVDYLSSARFGDTLMVRVRTERIGGSSHGLTVRIDHADDPDHLVAAARVVVVGLDHYGGRPSRMPAQMRSAIEAFEAGPAQT